MKVRVELYKKNTMGGYDPIPKIIENTEENDDIINFNIDRRIFEISTLDCLIDNTKRDKTLIDVVHTELGYFDNHNIVKLYIDDKIAFTGVLKDYKYDEDKNTYFFRAEDMVYKIFKTIDCTPYLIYQNTTAFAVIRDLFNHAGINIIKFSDEVTDYPIKKIKIEYNNTYVDVLDKFFSVMYARFKCNRDGSVDIVRAYPPYDGVPITKYKFESVDFITNGGYDRTESNIRNKLVVKASDKDIQAFICPYLLKHCNNEVYLDVAEEELADTLEKKKNVALKYFRDKLRHSKRFSLTVVDGNLNREIGDIARIVLNQSDVKGWAMVNGITTNIQDGIWQDTLELELLVADKWIIPQAVEGNYITTSK